MSNTFKKLLRKCSIEETLNKRKYIGYRIDLILIKFVLTLIFSILIYINTISLYITLILAIQFFMILTLINKCLIDYKYKKGKEKLLLKVMKRKFRLKLFSVSYVKLENFIKLYLNQKRVCRLEKKQNYHYTGLLNGNKVFINILKYFPNAEIEKIDIRNCISKAYNRKIKKLVIITLNDLEEDIDDLIENLNNIEITVIKFEELFEFAYKNKLLSENYRNISLNDLVIDKKSEKQVLFVNIFSNTKIYIYLIASVIFFIISKLLILSSIGKYIAFYFLIMGVLTIIYNLYKHFTSKTV